MKISDRTINIMKDRQKILLLNDPKFKYIEHVSQYRPGKPTATLIHHEEVLFVAYKWGAKNISDVVHDSPLKINAELFAEHLTLSPSVGAAVVEHLLICERADADIKGFVEEGWIGRHVPSKIVYCGDSWAGGLAFLQSMVAPPNYLVTSGDLPEFSKASIKYLRDKVKDRCCRFTHHRV